MSNMERWFRKVAVVTGASSGIGEGIARKLCQNGMIVIGLARRVDRLKNLQESLQSETGEFHYRECDVSNLGSVKAAFQWISENYSRICVLVNNAGINIASSILTEDNEEVLQAVINTNLMGSLYCTKEAYKIMKDGGQEESYYIININSILGHSIFRTSQDIRVNVYPSSKFGLKAASEVLRLELLDDQRFHISSISPGLVRTEIVAQHPYAKKFMAVQPTLCADDIARTVLFIISMEQHVQISDIIIKPIGERI